MTNFVKPRTTFCVECRAEMKVVPRIIRCKSCKRRLQPEINEAFAVLGRVQKADKRIQRLFYYGLHDPAVFDAPYTTEPSTWEGWTFVDLCEFLELNPEKMRKTLMEEVA